VNTISTIDGDDRSMNPVRVPVEFDLGSGLPTLRGVRVVGASQPIGRVLCLHDLGRDLDEFGVLPTVLAAGGFVVEAVDLPGHGLSDGDDGDVSAVAPTIAALVARVRVETPTFGLIAVGASATLGATVGEPDGVLAQVLINPVLDERLPTGPRVRSTRLVVQGEHANLVGTRTQRYFSHVLGEKLLVFNPSIAEGAAAVGRVDAVATHVALFLRRYLVSGGRPPQRFVPPTSGSVTSGSREDHP
jgi:pimeloyl-ACP methyl ester carboxylesterase